MNELVKTESATAVPETPFATPWLAQLRAALGEMNGRPWLMSGAAMSVTERKAVKTEAQRLRAKLSPAQGDTERKAAAITRLIDGFRTQADGAEVRADTYLYAVDNLPAWAVVTACQRIIRGETTIDPRFAPTPPQVAQYARMVAGPLQRDLETLDKIAESVTEEEFQRVCDGFDALRAELSPEKPRTLDPSATFRARCDELGIDPDSIPDANASPGWGKPQPPKMDAA